MGRGNGYRPAAAGDIAGVALTFLHKSCQLIRIFQQFCRVSRLYHVTKRVMTRSGLLKSPLIKWGLPLVSFCVAGYFGLSKVRRPIFI